MDEHKEFVIGKTIEDTAAALAANGMQVHFARKKSDVNGIVKTLISKEDIIRFGGSMSMEECGVKDMLKKEGYNTLEREDVTDMREYHLSAFTADVFMASANAVTENGFIVNVDGTGSRVAPMIFGPPSVIIIVGYNKIVANVEEARIRLQEMAAPANNHRLSTGNPCTEVGYCVDCRSPNRICRHYVVHGPQKDNGRMKVIIVGEQLGY